MADSFKSAAQLQILNNNNAIDAGATNIFASAPALKSLAYTESSNGRKHIYTRYITEASGGFRSLNDGIENSMTVDEEVPVDLVVIDASWQDDVKKARSYKGGVDAYMARESERKLASTLAKAEKQMFYGKTTTTHGDAAGFAGFADDSNLNNKTDSRVIDATGTTVGGASSVWFVRSVDNLTDVAVVVKDGSIAVEPYYQTPAAGATGRYDAYRQPILGDMAIQMGGAKSIARIANLTAEAGKGLTDALMAKAFELFPADAPPTHIFMNTRSLGQLRASRTATTESGKEAPYPTDWNGVKVTVTDNIVSTEALLV